MESTERREDGYRLIGILNVASKITLSLAVAMAVVLLLLAFPRQFLSDPAKMLTAGLFSCLRLAADVLPVHSRRSRLAESTTAVDFALVLLVGVGGAVLAVALAAVARTIIESSRERSSHPLIAISRAIVAVGFSGLVYDAAMGARGFDWTTAGLLGVAAAALTYMALDVVLALVGMPDRRTEVSAAGWARRWLTLVVQYTGLLALGAIGAAVFSFSPVGSLILLLPVGVAHYTLRSAMAARATIRRAVESLATQIDQRESYTAQHSQRVATYARRVCQGLRLGAYDTDLIVGVARIHDLGKLNLWPEMLNKAGPLDDAERLEMNRHPAYGARILAGFVDYRHAREIILHHHEWYDGKGYPAGLQGDQIPLGSRIIAVVDAFDAMTSHRPYRGALSYELAVQELRANAGSQFDPEVVETFVKVVRPEDIPQTTARRSYGRPPEVAKSTP